MEDALLLVDSPDRWARRSADALDVFAQAGGEAARQAGVRAFGDAGAAACWLACRIPPRECADRSDDKLRCPERKDVWCGTVSHRGHRVVRAGRRFFIADTRNL